MTDETGSAGSEAMELPADAPEVFNTAREAADYFTSLQEKRKNPPAESADPATAEPELAVEANADPLDAAPGEDEDADPASKEPPIERPKSWTESEEAEWQSTPRALQQKIAARELERDTALRRAQNEAAEKLKGLTAKEQQAEEARQKYEAKLPQVMQQLTDQNNRQFADIKSMSDLETLANEALRLSTTDPVAAGQIQAYLQAWNVHQQKMVQVKAELDQAEQSKTTKEQTDWAAFMGQENAKARELIPELADPVKGPELERRAAAHLAKIGFNGDELNALAGGKQKLSVYDHRIQVLINDSLRLAELQEAKATVTAKVAPKNLPPVQRPGTSRPSGQGADSERIQALNRKPELTVKEATELYQLQNRSTRRAS